MIYVYFATEEEADSASKVSFFNKFLHTGHLHRTM